jgi:hypothetical protein
MEKKDEWRHVYDEGFVESGNPWGESADFERACSSNSSENVLGGGGIEESSSDVVLCAGAGLKGGVTVSEKGKGNEVEVPDVVLKKYREERRLDEGIPDDVVVGLIRDGVAEQAMIFAGCPESVKMDIDAARRIFSDPVEMGRATLATLLVGMGIIEADKRIRAKVADGEAEGSPEEISALVDELVAMKKASAFADEFYGSSWDVGPAPYGWRHDMQKWAEGKGLIKPIKGPKGSEGAGMYVGFTRKGELLQEELRRRGHTIVVGN